MVTWIWSIFEDDVIIRYSYEENIGFIGSYGWTCGVRAGGV